VNTTGTGSRLCAWWVRWYTRRLPTDVAEERRAEMASDVWEHVADARRARRNRWAIDVEVIGRVLSGVPADLSWRRGLLRSQLRPDQGAPMYLHRFRDLADKALLVLVAVGAGVGFTLMPFLIGSVAARNIAEVVWTAGAAVLAAMLVIGIILRGRRPRLSTTLIVIGAAAPALAWFWLPPTYLLSLAIVLAALGAHHDTTAAPATG
jgi:hypothetical protein